MKSIKIIKVGVSYKGKDILPGDTVETDENSANSLIADGYAVENTEADALKSPVSPSNPSGDKIPAGEEKTASDANMKATGVKNEGTGTDAEDELAKTKKALNDQYKRDELYDAAIKAGVEIAYDAKKADIVDAVVAQGKVEALLK